MKFEYVLNGIGWADVKIEIDGEVFYSFPSYLSEPLIDLCEGILSIIPDYVPNNELKAISSFKWFGEPSVDKWSIKLLDNSTLNIFIEHFEDESTVKGKVKFNVTCNLLDFIRELVSAIEHLLCKHGFVGYKNTWYGQDFPISSFLKLKYYLNSQMPYPILEETNDVGIEMHKSDFRQEIKLLLGDIRNI